MVFFDVVWCEIGKFEKGFDYFYFIFVNFDKFNDMGFGSVIIDEIEVDGERRYKIVFVIGFKDGLGVECLWGFGLIVGEIFWVYDDIFIIFMVIVWLVGIGVYFVRLG